ncbi:MAG TPA: glycosyltransferase, partial [Patescibacteria group bacterium]|nr:glycosyltransferase [Patescibacteria group bacterium]
MKICLINNLYTPYNHGGAEKVCAQMAKDYKSQNNEVFIITTKPKHPNLEKNVSDNIYYINSEFYNLKDKSIPSRLFWHLGNIFSFKKYFRVLNILIQEKPDLIISHNLMGVGFMAAKAISKSNVKHHHFLHDIQLLHPSGLIIYGKEQKLKQLPAKLYRFFTRKMINSPELVISPS